MNKIHAKPKTGNAQKVKALVTKLNQYRHEYYNLAAPSVSDAVYDRLYDELQGLEKRTGIIYGNSPTQTVGYAPVSALEKTKHPIPLLSLDKTKRTEELLQMLGKADALLMLKLDGLTIKLCYEKGELAEASTRGDGDVGELITHNIPAFYNIPLKIPYKGRLVITGEGLIHNNDFEKLKDKAFGSGGKEACNARNLAAGSIRVLNPSVCKDGYVYFYAFNMIEGMEAFGEIADSRGELLQAIQGFGFDVCPFVFLKRNATHEEIEIEIQKLKALAEDMQIPIDGMVLRYDSLSYSKGCGRTGHHYKDGIAFKFEDDTYETVFRSVEWETSRSGEIAPVALFDPVEIDGCLVSRASLHNLSFIKDLELHSACRILVSKRNMIIPHIEENLDRGRFSKNLIPKKCPCCGKSVRVFSRAGDKGRLIETLHCDNPDCGNRILRKFVHFAEKKAMDISGISEATIARFIEKGFLRTFHDFYHLDCYRNEIVQMDGFGEKSYKKIQESVDRSRNTTFVKYVVAMDIPMIGRTASRVLDQYFNGDLQGFAKAAADCFDFTSLSDFGETMSRNIWEWFHDRENRELWKSLQKELNFEKREDNFMENKNNNTGSNPFTGCTIVATGKLENFTRDGINSKIISLGATAGSVEPTLKENSLFYDGEYFKVGEGRAAITEDKISDDTAMLHTMAAVAMELRNAGLHKAEVILAVGLPFSNYGRDKLKLIDYYKRQSALDFSYEGEDYSIVIRNVIVCPQCYSAVASRLGNMKGDYLIVDIGSKTTDVVYVQNGLPIESKSITIEKAMVKWIKEIQREMKVQTGKDIPEHEVMKVALKEDSNLPSAYAELIRGMLREKLHSLELELAERGYSLDYINIIYVGGGALMARDYAGKYRGYTAYDCDLYANAKGYEFLASQIERKQVA